MKNTLKKMVALALTFGLAGAAQAGINAGVTLASGAGQFTTNLNVTASDVALFTSDNPAYVVKFVTDHLELKAIVTFTPAAVDHATPAVYVNDEPVEKTGDVFLVPSNSTATVVYTAEGGYFFADGSAAKTNALNTTVSPAVVKGGTPAAPAEPSVKVGKPAQRYPWNGVVDVPYRLKNWPAGGAGYKVKFLVQVGAAAPLDGGTTVPAGSGGLRHGRGLVRDRLQGAWPRARPRRSDGQGRNRGGMSLTRTQADSSGLREG